MGMQLPIILCAILTHASDCHFEQRYQAVFPQILMTFEQSKPTMYFEDAERLREHGISLGAYDTGALPLYLRYLRDNPNSIYYFKILGIVVRIGKGVDSFVPLAISKLASSATRLRALAFLGRYGEARAAKAVAALLLDAELDRLSMPLVFKCLKRIGTIDELEILREFALKNIGGNPKLNWVPHVEDCRAAIHYRLEAQDKGLLTTPYRNVPDPWVGSLPKK